MSGWEGAAWFAGAGQVPSAVPRWGRHPWWVNWRAEHTADRERVGLSDMSLVDKTAVRSPDAANVLERGTRATSS
ncbi:MAG: hypothetical protein ABR500_00420 [Dermatophilaceae bacterium]|nr:hypothetical protein [Intrasporangiaceae bacterium]